MIIDLLIHQTALRPNGFTSQSFIITCSNSKGEKHIKIYYKMKLSFPTSSSNFRRDCGSNALRTNVHHYFQFYFFTSPLTRSYYSCFLSLIYFFFIFFYYSIFNLYYHSNFFTKILNHLLTGFYRFFF